MKNEYLKQLHVLLVKERRELVTKSDDYRSEEKRAEYKLKLKEMDSHIGRIASVFNPLISAKTEAWLNQEYGE
jgi:hypothetical protein